MPHLTNSTPKYRRKKVSGQAIVTLPGRDFYLGLSLPLAEQDRPPRV